jgi:hypothetical protein
MNKNNPQRMDKETRLRMAAISDLHCNEEAIWYFSSALEEA